MARPGFSGISATSSHRCAGSRESRSLLRGSDVWIEAYAGGRIRRCFGCPRQTGRPCRHRATYTRGLIFSTSTPWACATLTRLRRFNNPRLSVTKREIRSHCGPAVFATSITEPRLRLWKDLSRERERLLAEIRQSTLSNIVDASIINPCRCVGSGWLS